MPDVDQEAGKARLRREAYRATSRAAAGKSTAEIEELYSAELRARGLWVPRHEVLAAVAEGIKGHPLPSRRLAGLGIVRMGQTMVRMVRGR